MSFGPYPNDPGLATSTASLPASVDYVGSAGAAYAATAGQQKVVRSDGTVGYIDGHVYAEAWGAKFDDATNDTAAIQAAIAQAITNKGTVILPDGKTARVTALTYNGGLWGMRGGGKKRTILKQIAGTAAPVIAATGAGWPYQKVVLEQFGIDAGTLNAASNTGGVQLRGSANSLVQRLWIRGTNGYGVQIIGGSADQTTGDAMYCHVDECDIESLGNGAAHVQISPTEGGGSHPDRARITNNFFNSIYANGTIGVLIDIAPLTSSNADGLYVAGNNMQGVPTPFDVNTQSSVFIGNTAELTGAGQTMAVHVRPGPANYPSNSNLFIGNEYATQGVSGNFTFDDQGVGTLRIEWNLPDGGGINQLVGAMFNSVLTDRIGVRTVGTNTVLSVLSTIQSTVSRTIFPHIGMTPMPGPPAIATGRLPGIFTDQNSAVGLYAKGGANGGVRAWLDNGANAVPGNVLDDGQGHFLDTNGNRVGVTKLYDSGAIGAPQASFDIQNIPAGYGSLVLSLRLGSARVATTDSINITFNNDGGGNYDCAYNSWAGGTAEENNAQAAVTAATIGRCPASSAGANILGAARIEIPGYDDAANNKSFAGRMHWKEGGATVNIITGITGGDWRSNAAINRITIVTATASNFIAGSRVVLYGMP